MIDDVQLMRLALAEAIKGRGRTSPNPLVGCVIAKGGLILAMGFHRRAGEDHAEVDALRKLAFSAPGCTAYVTLEPCNHHGRTPACTEALIKAQIERVVVATEDPNPGVLGQGIARMRAAGIRVEVGLCREDAERLNEVYLHTMRCGRPFVAVKIAQSLDGAVATARGQSRWITGTKAREHGHRLRDEYDAILVGAGTVAADNPRLTTRLPDGRNPRRIVVNSGADLDPASKVFSPRTAGGCILAVTRKAPAAIRREFVKQGVDVLVCRRARATDDGQRTTGKARATGKATDNGQRTTDNRHHGHVDLGHLFEQLAARDITSVLVEGGSAVLGSLFDHKLVDKVYAFIAPMILGGASLRAVGGRGASTLGHAPRLIGLEFRPVGQDLMVVGYPSYPA